eukprot:364653-Chlamydomonas_euryale.AAC.12
MHVRPHVCCLSCSLISTGLLKRPGAVPPAARPGLGACHACLGWVANAAQQTRLDPPVRCVVVSCVRVAGLSWS